MKERGASMVVKRVARMKGGSNLKKEKKKINKRQERIFPRA